jgi:hypothetical protein
MAFIAVFITNFALLLPMSTGSWYVFPRSSVAIAGVGGLLIICMASCAQKINKWALLPAVLFVLIISYVHSDIQRSNYASNKLDMHELAGIVNIIRSYEEHHEITVTRILFMYEEPHKWQRESVRSYNDLTQSLLQNFWVPEPMLRYFLGDGVIILPMNDVMTDAEIERIINLRENFWFTNGFIVFEYDSVYIFFKIHSMPERNDSDSLAVVAVPTLITVTIGSRTERLQAFNIANRYYVNIHDIAYFLNDTAARFDIGYNDECNTLTLIMGQNYIPAEGETRFFEFYPAVVTPADTAVIIEDNQIGVITYLIRGSDYFMLRDLADILGFDVGWNRNANSVDIIIH